MNKIVTLVVVSEGKIQKGKRSEPLNPIAFQGYNMKSDDLWEGIGAVLRREYDIESIKTISIHSDVGSWIMTAKDKLNNVEFVMDEFHIVKRIKSICEGSIGKAYASKITRAIKSGNHIIFCDVIKEMINDIPNYEKTDFDIHRRREKILEQKIYFVNNWESIQKTNLKTRNRMLYRSNGEPYILKTTQS